MTSKQMHPDDPTGVRFEYPDPRPVELPVDDGSFPNTLDELVAQASARQLLAAQLVPETFEEADDFDVGDDFDVTSPWEIAADAAAMTADELFQAVYGMTRDQALAENARRLASGQPAVPPGGTPANSGVPGASPSPAGNAGVSGGTPEVNFPSAAGSSASA